MSRPNPVILAAILLAFLAVTAALYLAKGGLYTATHEGDLYHHLDIVYRMVGGERIHRDFMTPLGIFTVAPHVWFMQAGLGAGMAFAVSQIAVAAILLPIILYAAATRFRGWTSWLFGLITLALPLALVHGGASVGLSISMHYNRWSWAVAFLVLALAMLPPLGRARPALDGVLIGAGLGVLALLKLTYFVAYAPVVAVALVWPWRPRAILAAIVGGLAVALAVTLWQGPQFWLAYLDDLLTVATGEIRTYPGEPIEELIGGSRWIGGTAGALAAAFLFRRTGATRLAALTVLFAAASVYVTWQNYGNDPVWLALLALVVLAARPTPGTTPAPGGDAHLAGSVLAAALLALIFPSLFHMVTSPLRHFAMPEGKYEPLLPVTAGAQDWFIPTDRARMMNAELHLDQPGTPWEAQAAAVGRPPRPSLGGVEFPYCQFGGGTVAWFESIGRDLMRAGVPEGSQILTIDIVSAFWLNAPFAPLKDGAPWYYGELSGLENAEYILVPRCTFVESARDQMIADLNEAGIEVELVRANELYWLFATPQAPDAEIAR